MGASVTLEMVYEEVKKMNERLKHIEDAIEEVVTKNLPEMSVNKEKMEEIKESIRDMKKGNCVTLEELDSA